MQGEGPITDAALAALAATDAPRATSAIWLMRPARTRDTDDTKLPARDIVGIRRPVILSLAGEHHAANEGSRHAHRLNSHGVAGNRRRPSRGHGCSWEPARPGSL